MHPGCRIFLLSLFGAVRAAAADPPVPPDDISAELYGAVGWHGGWQPGVRGLWADARRGLDKRIHLDWTAGYLSAAVARSGGGGSRSGASGELGFQGVWDPAKDWRENATELRWRVRHRHAYGAVAASEVSPGSGALWGAVNGFTDAGLEVPDFFFRHEFSRPGIEMRYGQMSVDSQFGGHQLSSSRLYFLNQAFATDPGVAFPRFGAGITVMKQWENGLSLGGGATTIQGTQVGSQVDLEWSSDDLFQVFQLAYDFHGGNRLAHRLALLGWRSDAVEDADQPGGQGLQLTYERELDADGARIFSTLAWANGGANPLDVFATGGVGFPFRGKDWGGVAVGFGQGADFDRTRQAVVEGFYRWQVAENFQLTPDFQVLLGEGLAGSGHVDLVAGVRLAARF